MPFIGNKPTAVPLTSADLEDNIISTAKIQDDAVTTAKTSYSDAPYRNIIINGDMSIAQRGTSVSSITGNGYHTVDRFTFEITNAGTWTISQDTDVPTGQGFAKSLKLDCTTADASLGSSDKFLLQQKFEGQNLQYLKKGTSSAESLTLSFWVKSNKTGTYTINFYDTDNNRQIAKTYTIDSASTWEKKTLTFAGDTTGAFGNDNGGSLELSWCLGTGTNFTSGTLATSWESYTAGNRFSSSNVNLADSTSNDFWITGVQLEAGTTASDFEFLPYDVNLQRCLRYYEIIDNPLAVTTNFYNTTTATTNFTFSTVKRANPTVTLPASKTLYSNNASKTVSSYGAIYIRKDNFFVQTSGSGYTGGDCGQFDFGGNITLDAEL